MGPWGRGDMAKGTGLSQARRGQPLVWPGLYLTAAERLPPKRSKAEFPVRRPAPSVTLVPQLSLTTISQGTWQVVMDVTDDGPCDSPPDAAMAADDTLSDESESRGQAKFSHPTLP